MKRLKLITIVLVVTYLVLNILISTYSALSADSPHYDTVEITRRNDIC